jgi:hypothetical protein
MLSKWKSENTVLETRSLSGVEGPIVLYGTSLNAILCPNVPGNLGDSTLACPWDRQVPWVLSTTQKLLRGQGSHEQALAGHNCLFNALQSVEWTVVS